MRWITNALVLVLACSAHAEVIPEPAQLPAHALHRLGSFRLHPGRPIQSMSFSRDGSRLVTTAADAVIVWDTKTGARLMTLAAHNITPPLFVGKSLLVLNNYFTGVIDMWDIDRRKLVGSFGEVNARALATDPDDRRLFTASDEGIKSWTLPDLKPLGTTPLAKLPMQGTWQFSPSGRLLLAWQGDRNETEIVLQDVRDQNKVRSWKAPSRVDGVHISEDDATVSAYAAADFSPNGAPTRIFQWNAKDGSLALHEIFKRLGEGFTPTFTPDARSIIYMKTRREFVRSELPSLKETKYPALANPTYSSVMSYHGPTQTLALASNHDPMRLRFFDLKASKELLPSLDTEYELTDAQLSHDNRYLVCFQDRQIAVRTFDGKPLYTIAAKGKIDRAQLFPKLPCLMFSAITDDAEQYDHTFYDLEKRTVDSIKQGEQSYDHFHFVKGRDECAIIDKTDLRWWCPKEKRIVRRQQLPVAEEEIILEADLLMGGKWVVLSNLDFIRVAELASGKTICNYKQDGGIIVVQAAPDASTIAFVDNGRRLSLLPVHGKVKPRLLWEVDGEIEQLVYSPDGKHLAALYFKLLLDRYVGVALIDLETKRVEQIADFDPLDDPRIWFSPDGRSLGVSSQRRVRIYEFPSRSLRLRLEGHVGMARRLQFAADGQHLLTHGNDGTAIVWDLWRTKEVADLPAVGVDEFWKNLASADGERSHQALCRGIHDRGPLVAFLKKQVRPVGVLDVEVITRMITDLDHKEFPRRIAAQVRLERWRELALPTLRKARAGELSVETARRIDRLIEMQTRRISDPELLRQMRVIELLEYNATPAAGALLKELAGGNPDARLTQEARRALERRVSSSATRAR